MDCKTCKEEFETDDDDCSKCPNKSGVASYPKVETEGGGLAWAFVIPVIIVYLMVVTGAFNRVIDWWKHDIPLIKTSVENEECSYIHLSEGVNLISVNGGELIRYQAPVEGDYQVCFRKEK